MTTTDDRTHVSVRPVGASAPSAWDGVPDNDEAEPQQAAGGDALALASAPVNGSVPGEAELRQAEPNILDDMFGAAEAVSNTVATWACPRMPVPQYDYVDEEGKLTLTLGEGTWQARQHDGRHQCWVPGEGWSWVDNCGQRGFVRGPYTLHLKAIYDTDRKAAEKKASRPIRNPQMNNMVTGSERDDSMYQALLILASLHPIDRDPEKPGGIFNRATWRRFGVPNQVELLLKNPGGLFVLGETASIVATILQVSRFVETDQELVGN